MRYLAIGDIHGCFKALTTLAAFVQFQPDDTLITLGDYSIAGPIPTPWSMADCLPEAGQPVPLRGNHEVMMLQARDGDEAFRRWVQYGGDATLASYSPFGDAGRLVDVPDSHWQFLEATRPWFDTQTHFFVHANAYPDCPLDEQPDLMLYWEEFADPPPHVSAKVMVCGHTSQKLGRPRNLGHAVCIDTWVYGEGWLTCLDVASGQYWKANQQGETRRSKLAES
jgi:serine/threonine protein phosphatase 1